MPEGIRDKVAIVGMGCTKFGERWDADVERLVRDAVDEALEDAGVDIKDIQAIWVGTGRGSQQVPMGPCSGIICSSALQTQYIPVTRVENLCCAGQEAVRAATLGVLSKCYDLVLAVETAREMNIPHGVVINRCELGDDKVRRYCASKGIEVLLEIPFDRKIAECYSRAEVIAQSMPEYRAVFVGLFNNIKRNLDTWKSKSLS